MSNLIESTLTFDADTIQNTLTCKQPDRLYKYFTTKEARDNFLRGNIWFCGVNQNRFFAESYGGINDPSEYRNHIASYIFEYPLSFSTEILDESLYNIELQNISGFIEAIIKSIRSGDGHRISWLNLNELKRKKHKIALINTLEYLPCQEENFNLHVASLGVRKVNYVDKQKLFVGDSPMNTYVALSQAQDFETECEYRIHLNSGDFLGVHTGKGLYHLIQYIKINSPEAAQFCQKL